MTAPKPCGRILLKSLRFREFTRKVTRVDPAALGRQGSDRLGPRPHMLACLVHLRPSGVPHIAKSFTDSAARTAPEAATQGSLSTFTCSAFIADSITFRWSRPSSSSRLSITPSTFARTPDLRRAQWTKRAERHTRGRTVAAPQPLPARLFSR
jgi:hypothetical protein